MPLPPGEAKVLDTSRQLSAVMRLASVRMHLDRSSDGWVNLTIRGSSAAIENAKRRIDAIIHPGEAPSLTLAVVREEHAKIGAVVAAASTSSAGGASGGRAAGGVPMSLPHGDVNAPVPELLVMSSESSGGGFRIEIELTNKDQVGAVIGEGGKTINAIRATAGVTIQMENPDEAAGRAASTQRRVIITGAESACMQARTLVHDVLRSNTGKRDYSQRIDEGAAAESGGSLVKLTIPRHLVGKVIGTRGSTIRRLRESTGAIIDVAKSPESGVGTVTLSGPPAAVAAAREQIEALTAEELPIEVQQTLSRMLDEVLVIHVPPDRVGKVIGSRGAVIQGLRQETGVSIDLQKDETGGATVTLRGSMQAMCAARAAIEAIVQAEDAREARDAAARLLREAL